MRQSLRALQYPRVFEFALLSQPEVHELSGRGGGGAYLLLPSDAPVVQGDQVFYPYSGSTLMGVVGAIESDPASATKKAWVVFPTHPFAYTWVSIVPFSI